MEPALLELSLTLSQLSTSIDAMIIEQQRAERRRDRRSVASLVACLFVAAIMLLLAWIAVTNRTVLDTIRSVTNPAATARQAVSTRDILQRNAEETDCRQRRQHAGMVAPQVPPTPPPGITPADLSQFLAPYTCMAQTPPAVYPGMQSPPA